jgi:hypothetical protein
MGSTFGRAKTWSSGETLTHTDLNAEFDNILNNLDPAGVDDQSTNVAAMQVTFDPGNTGTENLPTSLKEELEALRFQIKSITGETNWYDSPNSSLTILSGILGVQNANNGVKSGLITNGGARPGYISVDGTSSTITVLGASTDLVYNIKGSEYTLSSDITVAGSGALTSGQDTGTVSDQSGGIEAGNLYGAGPNGEMLLSAQGTELTNNENKILIYGNLAGDDIGLGVAKNNGTNWVIAHRTGPIFHDKDEDCTWKAWANADTITAYAPNYLFITTTQTLAISTTTPFVQPGTPSGAVNGDYWFDTDEDLWKSFNGSVWADANATMIGIVGIDNSGFGQCWFAFDFLASYSGRCDLTLTERIKTGGDIIETVQFGGVVNVYGTVYNYWSRRLTWDINNDRDGGVSLTASKWYYFYINDTGGPNISDIPPVDRRSDLKGWYHPLKTYRCLGMGYFNSASDFEQVHSFGADLDISPGTVSQEIKRPMSFEPISLVGTQAWRHGVSYYEELDILNLSKAGTSTGSSSVMPVRCTGRPIMITLSPTKLTSVAGGVLNVKDTATAISVVITLKRNDPMINTTYNAVGNIPILLPFAASDYSINPCLTFLDIPGRGYFNYRIDVSVTEALDFDLSGRLYVFEL